MGGDRHGGVSRQIRALFDVGTVAGLGDAELLERFADRGGEASAVAFAALVDRHGPMVLRVCRGVLRDEHEAMDAFQATFLVLALKAGSVRKRTSLASWLHGVGFRVAACARAEAARRRRHERRAAEMAAGHAADEGPWDDLAGIIHEELDRLPERYRAPLVLCDLEGLTHEEAAGRLAWPVGSVKGRLARGREKLRARLTRRGLAPTAGSPVAILAVESARSAVPAALMTSTARAATRCAAGKMAAGVVSASAAALTRGVLRTMILTKLKMTAMASLTVALIASGVVVSARQGGADRPTAPRAVATPPPRGQSGPNPAVGEGPTPQLELQQVLREAVRIARPAGDSYVKREVLRDLASAQAESGDREESRTTFQLAIQAASGEPDDHDRALALIQIAASQAEAGFVDEAIRTANSLTDDRSPDVLGEDRSRLDALAKVATARVKVGDVAGALRAADMIDGEDVGEDVKAPLLEDIATAQAAAGDLRGARGWVERIGSPTARSRALLGIARGMAKRKQGEGPSQP